MDFFIEKRAHLALVSNDEENNMIGLITLEDIMETLLGLEIIDENESAEDVQHLARKKWDERAEDHGVVSESVKSDEKHGDKKEND